MGDQMISDEYKDIPFEIKQVIIKERLQQWKNTQFRAWVDLGVAKKIPDAKMEADAMKEMQACESAIQQLEMLLKDLIESI